VTSAAGGGEEQPHLFRQTCRGGALFPQTRIHAAGVAALLAPGGSGSVLLSVVPRDGRRLRAGTARPVTQLSVTTSAVAF